MVTMHEARQRLNLANMRLFRVDREFGVTFADKPRHEADKLAYFSDDLEDVMITGLLMRNPRVRKCA